MIRVSFFKKYIIAPKKDIISARHLALMINTMLRDDLYHHQEKMVFLTISIGLASLNDSAQELRSIQLRTDKALNKTIFFGANHVIMNDMLK